MTADRNIGWLESKTQRSGDLLGDDSSDKPSLQSLWGTYQASYAPRRNSVAHVGLLADFVEMLRNRDEDKTQSFTDVEWIDFFMHFTEGDSDRAADLWDGFVCQP